MDVLILYCSTGGGHISAGQALKEELEQRGHHADMVDAYTIVSSRFADWLGHTYEEIVRKAPILWGMFYQIGRFRNRLPFHTLVYKLNRYMAEPMSRFFEEHPYDVILTLHVFPAQMFGGMKEQGYDLPKTVLVSTDYFCPPMTAEADNDYYIVPAGQLTDAFLSEEIPASRLRALGIPVRRAFNNRTKQDTADAGSRFADSLSAFSAHTGQNTLQRREECRQLAAKQLGLSPDRHYLLLSGGSIGAGNMRTAARTIEKYLKSHPAHDLIIICGNNDSLYQKLCRQYRNHPQILLLRHTDRMADYMRACDVLITKPGGLTSTEAAVCGVPLIHISPIPGCERKNAAFFFRRGMSLCPKNCRRQLTAALKRLEDPAAAGNMIERQRQGINPGAAADICDFAEKIVRTKEKTVNCTGNTDSIPNGEYCRIYT